MRNAFLLALTCLLAAQTPPLRTTVHLVVAPVTVTDARGNTIDGLTQKDFRLLDNGQLREVTLDVAETPISLVVAVQCSSFSAAALNKVHKIGSLLEPLVTGEHGEIAVVAFDSEVQVRQEFTSDFGKVQKALSWIEPGDEGGRMIDAAAESVRLLASRPPARRRVLLLIGETRDRGSKGKIEDVVTQAQRENVTVYPVSYSAYATAFTAKAGGTPSPRHDAQPRATPIPTTPAAEVVAQGEQGGGSLLALIFELARMGKTNAANALAQYSGGEHLSFTKQKGIESAVARIGEELHSQYLLSFTVPEQEDNVFHRIEVTVPGRPEARVRTRPGYWMAPVGK